MEKEDGIRLFICLPQEDVLYGKILCYLSLKELFRMKTVCKTLSYVVQNFCSSSICSEFDFSLIGSGKNFSSQDFERILKGKNNLLRLNLTSCKHWLQNKDIIPVIQNNLMLKHLSLYECYNVSNDAFLEIGTYLKFLQLLDLSYCRHLLPETLTTISSNINSLTSVDISGCWNVTDNCVKVFAINNKNLSSFSCMSCYALTDASIMTLGKNCRNLEKLNIIGCWRVTDNAMFIINEYCKNLKKLFIKECTKITEISISRMRVRGIKIDIPKPRYIPKSVKDVMLQI